MNILIFSWRDLKHPLSGGAEQVMHEHAKGWIAAGHSVTWFSSTYKDAPQNEILDGITIFRRGGQLLDVQVRGFIWYLFGKHSKFDLVVDQFHGISFFTPLYVRVKKLAVLQEVAREIWLANYLPKPFNWIIGTIGYLGEPFIFLLYKNVSFMVGSQSAKKDLTTYGIAGNHITIIPHGVIIEQPDLKIKKEAKKTIIFLGALQQDKGTSDAIKAFSLLKDINNSQLWIIGRGSIDYTNYLKKLCKDLKVMNKVKFWGFVSQHQKFELLRRSHLLVNPSIREGWGLVNIEANSMGIPVVAYKSAGLIDSVKDDESGVFVDKNTPEELANKINLLLDDNSLYKRLSLGALNWSKQFNWQKSKELSLKLIESLTSEQ